MRCKAGHDHEALKVDPARWATLPLAGSGIQKLGDGEALELRNCTCGSTLAILLRTS